MLIAGLDDHLPKGVPRDTLMLTGSPPSVLARVAKERKADEIVVGAHGSDPQKRDVGNVPLALLGEADRPVVVVPSNGATG